LNNDLTLKPLDPLFHKYEAKDFFSRIGPLKVYSSENELSMPFTCSLLRRSVDQSYGIVVKGDCPVRVNQVDPTSYAYVSSILFSFSFR
jgi:hypothetical protein